VTEALHETDLEEEATESNSITDSLTVEEVEVNENLDDTVLDDTESGEEEEVEEQVEEQEVPDPNMAACIYCKLVFHKGGLKRHMHRTIITNKLINYYF